MFYLLFSICLSNDMPASLKDSNVDVYDFGRMYICSTPFRINVHNWTIVVQIWTVLMKIKTNI